jgi:thiol:disulfide interchange protein DsbC
VFKTQILSIFALFSIAASSVSYAVPQTVQQNIINGLKNGPAGLEVFKVESTPVSGIYQVSVSGNQVFYTSEDGQFIFTGKMYQVANGKVTDVQQLQQSLANIKRIQQVPDQNTIVYPAQGPTKYQLNIFTDVDCPYCAKLHQEIPALNASGVKVRYLAYPRAGLESSSFSKIASVWCSDTPKQSLDLMYQNIVTDAAECDNSAIKAQYQLALELGIQGTPAIFFKDGKMMYGFHSAADLLKMVGIQ